MRNFAAIFRLSANPACPADQGNGTVYSNTPSHVDGIPKFWISILLRNCRQLRSFPLMLRVGSWFTSACLIERIRSARRIEFYTTRIQVTYRYILKINNSIIFSYIIFSLCDNETDNLREWGSICILIPNKHIVITRILCIESNSIALNFSEFKDIGEKLNHPFNSQINVCY